MYFLKKLENLNILIKFLFKFFLFILIYKVSYSEIIYKKNDLIITEFDIRVYQQLYEENYRSKISNSNSLKDLILINNLIRDLEINNPEFMNKIDTDISIRFGENLVKNEGVKNFLRFSRIRDEFLINYFQNELNLTEMSNIFKELSSLNLPISIDDCLIIKDIIDLKDNEEFIKNFYNNLKNNTQEFQITINNVRYKVCINESTFMTIKNLIVEYIKIQTSEEFETFVYAKTKN